MKALLKKITKILKNKKTRKIWYRAVSSIAAVVVFVTTYVLILPAITLESSAAVCGMEAHQHSDDCYEDKLVCGEEESEGHHHDDECYTVSRELVCGIQEHRHDDVCFDEDGNLICQEQEHTHSDHCYQEDRELTCRKDESEGHHHDSSCYEKVLTCGKEAHTHNDRCYLKDDKGASGADAADTAGEAKNAAEPEKSEPEKAKAENAEPEKAEETLPENKSNTKAPQLDPVNMEAMLNKHTDMYYFHAEDGEDLPADNMEIEDWQKVKDDTELGPDDLVRAYLAYTIPAGSLNETNPVARYRLPENIRLTDKQIKAINKNENGIAAAYSRDSADYKKYLGAEAVEGDRRPGEMLNDGGQEYISAVVRAENVYKNDKYIGQDLIFTFAPYTVEKNQNAYDADGNTVKAGQKVTGWFVCDFNMGQVEWKVNKNSSNTDGNAEEKETAEKAAVKTVEKTAEVVFAAEDKKEDIKEISRTLKLVEQDNEAVQEKEPEEELEKEPEEELEKEPEKDPEKELEKEPEKEPEKEQEQEYESGTLTSDGGQRSDSTALYFAKRGVEPIDSTTDEQTTNLAEFVTDATIEIEGRTYGAGETWPVREDVGYALKLTFKEKGSRQFPRGGEEMVMEPADLGGMALVLEQSGTFDIPMGLYGVVTGNQWWVDSDGVFHIQFGDDPDDLLTRSNNTYIKLSFNVDFSGSEGQIQFNDNVKRDWEANKETDVSVTKSGHYNADTGKMEYTVTVTSTGHTTNIKVTDTFAIDNLLTLDQSSITFAPEKELAETGNYTGSNGFTRVIKEMTHGEKVTITYTADVNESALGPNGRVIDEDGKNSVVVEDDQDDEDETTNIVHEIKFSDLDKAAVSQMETDDGKIRMSWEITANTERRASLVGSTITDRIDLASKDIMKYAKSGGKVQLHVTGTDGQGNTYPVDAPAVIELTPDDTQGQESWIWTVQNIGEPEGTPLSYSISYDTIADKQKDNAAVKNDAENSSGGNDTGVGVVPGTNPGGGDTPPSIVTEKAATAVTPEYIDWAIVINVPEEGFPDGLTVTDYIPRGLAVYDENNYGFADRLAGAPTVSGLTGTETFKWKVEDDYSNHFYRNGENYAAQTLTIDFYESYDSEAQNDPGLGVGPRTITISLRTQNDQMWMDYAMTQGTGDTIYKHTNTGKVNDTDITAYAIPLKPALEKEHRYTSEKDGLPVYEYMITLSNVTELPVVIEDTFNSEFLDFYRIGVDGYPPYNYIAAAEQKYQLNKGVEGYAATAEQTGPGKITITANDLPRKTNGAFYEYYRIYYCLKVKDADALADLKNQAVKNGGKYTLTNTAVWGDLPDKCDVDYEVKVVSKDGYFASSNNPEERKFTFVIDVNPDGFDLSDGGTVELTDQHTKNLSVDYSSVKIYKIPEGTSIADVKAAARNNQLQPDWLCTSGSIPWNFVGNSGTFTLEDQTHYVIVYDAIVIGSGKQKFSNIANLEGFIAYKEEERTYSSGSAAGGDIWEIKLLKYKDGLTSNGLQGATFQLFKGTGEYYQETDGINTWWTEHKEPMKYGDTASTRERGLVGRDVTFTTGSDGLVIIRLDEVNDGNEIEGGVHYYLKEIESPAGYQIDSSTEYWSFTLTTDPDEVNYGDDDRRDEYGNLQWVYFYYNDILKMANTETTEPLDVVVNKSWFDKDGNPITGENLDETFVAKVQLMRKTDNGDYVPVIVEPGSDGPVITERPASTEESQVQLTKENKWSYTWNDLPRVELDGDSENDVVHRYAYKIEEVEVDGYVVSVSETETETVKTYALNNYKTPDNKTTNVTVNKEWQDAEGKKIDGTAPKLPQEIQFELYRAVSTTPFTGVPTTGGNLYVIADDPHLVDRTASEGDADYGLYKLTRSEGWTATFNNLPEIVTTDSGITYYYAYYVKEIPLDGYTASYTSDGTTRTIVNREPLDENSEYINIGLQKKWKRQDGTIAAPPRNASATFTVHQQKAEATSSAGGNITVNLVDSTEQPIASLMASDGDQLLLNGYHFADWQQGNGVYKDIYYKTQYSRLRAGQLVENWKGEVSDVVITVNESLMAINNVITLQIDTPKAGFSILPVFSNSSGSSSISYSEYADTGFTRTVAFPTTAGKWETTIKDLLKKDAEGNLYRYYITEDSCSPMAESVEFVDQGGSDIRAKEETKPTTDPLTDDCRSVVVTNTYETTDFVFSKEWHDIGDNVDPDWHGDIRVFVQRKIGNGASEAVGKYTIHKENAAFVISKDNTTPDAPDLVNVSGYTFKISDLPKKGITGDVTGEYVYFVTEETVSGYIAAEYKNPSVSSTEEETTWITSSDYALNNGKIINRPEKSVELPHTGGPGTHLFTILGRILLLGAGVLLLRGRRLI